MRLYPTEHLERQPETVFTLPNRDFSSGEEARIIPLVRLCRTFGDTYRAHSGKPSATIVTVVKVYAARIWAEVDLMEGDDLTRLATIEG